MRQLTEIEIERIKQLTENSVEITLIEPTQTGLSKSIMDATGTVRSYLKERNIHDYEVQKQGQENKILIDAFLVSDFELISSVASLYRPITKKGDPRIWFRGLGTYCNPSDILGIFEFQHQLYVINISKFNINALIEQGASNPLKELISEIRQQANEVANELLARLREIASRGPIPAMLNADTAIGRTLETLLGIDINSSKSPDYKGIELKSFRDKKRGNRKTLFAQVPDWSLSKFKSSSQILENFGYKRGDDLKLNCTVSTIVRNSQGLKLTFNEELNQLLENSNKSSIGDFAVWLLDLLHKRLLEKHNETFWISADPIMRSGVEHFVYKEVQHTRKPIISQFDILLQQGIITLDHLIKKNSKGKVIERGPLFKIKPNSLGLLFPPSKKYSLV